MDGENTASIDDLARGEEEEKGRRESYHTSRFYHMVMPQASNRNTDVQALTRGYGR
jgi:hypothetical protein